MATRSERPRVKRRAERRARGAEGVSKVRTFGWRTGQAQKQEGLTGEEWEG